MKKKDHALIADLQSCLDGIKEARASMEIGPKHGGKLAIEIGAFEIEHGTDGFDRGGAFMPALVGAKVLDAAEKIILDELKALGAPS